MVIALYVGKVTLLCESGIILVGKIWLALRNHYILGGGGEIMRHGEWIYIHIFVFEGMV